LNDLVGHSDSNAGGSKRSPFPWASPGNGFIFGSTSPFSLNQEFSMLYRCSSAVIAVGLIYVIGCGPAKLNETRTWNLDDELVAQSLDLSAQPKPQTIHVEFSSSGNEVSVYLFKAEDAKGDKGLTEANPEKALALKTNTKNDSFSAEVPPNTATRVIVRRNGGGKAEVKLKVTN
jgi:hypothetical protein